MINLNKYRRIHKQLTDAKPNLNRITRTEAQDHETNQAKLDHEPLTDAKPQKPNNATMTPPRITPPCHSKPSEP